MESPAPGTAWGFFVLFCIKKQEGKMDCIEEWLVSKPYGYGDLSCEEKHVAMQFMSVWGIWELKVCGLIESNGQSLGRVGIDSFTEGHLNAEIWLKSAGESVAYFKDRYKDAGKLSALGLHRDRKMQCLVQKIINTNTYSESECAKAVMYIAYRLRNNLFHGVKWSDGLQGQAGNFRHASHALMRSLDCLRGAEPSAPA
ncbi:MAG: hypothetical protein ACJAVR_001275 [Paracoccaceae bacterium]